MEETELLQTFEHADEVVQLLLLMTSSGLESHDEDTAASGSSLFGFLFMSFDCYILMCINAVNGNNYQVNLWIGKNPINSAHKATALNTDFTTDVDAVVVTNSLQGFMGNQE